MPGINHEQAPYKLARFYAARRVGTFVTAATQKVLTEAELRMWSYLSEHGAVFVPLSPSTKIRCRNNGWVDFYAQLHATERLDTALGWLTKGKPVGILLRDSNVWGIDFDTAEAYAEWKKKNIAAPVVRTASGKYHVYLTLPSDIDKTIVKSHQLGSSMDSVPKIDIKYRGNTYLILPGSKLDVGTYTLEGDWFAPPEVDPYSVFAEKDIVYKHLLKRGALDPDYLQQAKEMSVFDCLRDGYWVTQHEPDTAAWFNELNFYLRYQASYAVSGIRGHRTLNNVISSVIMGWDFVDPNTNLPDPKAIASLLISSGWNDRCLDGQTREPYPWSFDELVRAVQNVVIYPHDLILLHRRTCQKCLLRGLIVDYSRSIFTAPQSTFVSTKRLYEDARRLYPGLELPYPVFSVLLAKVLREYDLFSTTCKGERGYRGIYVEPVYGPAELLPFAYHCKTRTVKRENILKRNARLQLLVRNKRRAMRTFETGFVARFLKEHTTFCNALSARKSMRGSDLLRVLRERYYDDLTAHKLGSILKSLGYRQYRGYIVGLRLVVPLEQAEAC